MHENKPKRACKIMQDCESITATFKRFGYELHGQSAKIVSMRMLLFLLPGDCQGHCCLLPEVH